MANSVSKPAVIERTSTKVYEGCGKTQLSHTMSVVAQASNSLHV